MSKPDGCEHEETSKQWDRGEFFAWCTTHQAWEAIEPPEDDLTPEDEQPYV